MGASARVHPYAVTYLRISALGAPAYLVGLAATGYLRGLQDTRTTLIVAVAANVVNLVLEVVLVFGLDSGIAGSAWGTVLAQVGAAVAYVVIVARSGARDGRIGVAAARRHPDRRRHRRAADRADGVAARRAAGRDEPGGAHQRRRRRRAPDRVPDQPVPRALDSTRSRSRARRWSGRFLGASDAEQARVASAGA